MNFNEINLIEPLLNATKALKYEKPTPIQENAIPVLLNGKDLLGCAKTGTGKTMAFALPILQQLYLRDESDKYPRVIKALILAPTRELALQIDETFQSLSPFVNLKSTAIFGGVRQGSQVSKLERGIDVLVATPGRLHDLHQQGLLDLSQVEYFVLDEADRMLDMGFIKDIRRIMKLIPKQRQTMLFSATLPNEIKHLVGELLTEPETVMVSAGHQTVDKITQSMYFVDKDNKAKLLIKLLEKPGIYNAIVFVRTKRNVETLCKKLVKAKIEADGIHGDKSQNSRVRALNRFKNGETRILVATDIAARGIDIDVLTHVINYDLPEQAENYVHRIGRTARKGQSGEAITFCCHQEKGLLNDVEKFTKQSIPVIENTYYPMVNLEEAKPKSTQQNKPKQNKKPTQTKSNPSPKSKQGKTSDRFAQDKRVVKVDKNKKRRR